MDRVAAKQTGPLLDVVGLLGSQHNGPEPKFGTRPGSLDQDAGQQPADATEAVEHNVGGFFEQLPLPGGDRREFAVEVGPKIGLTGAEPAVGELAEVDLRRVEVHVG